MWHQRIGEMLIRCCQLQIGEYEETVGTVLVYSETGMFLIAVVSSQIDVL